MKESLRVVFVVVVVCCCAVMAVAGGVPQTLNYQGTLTDSTGAPVTAKKSMTFRMYTTAMGGSKFWEEPAKPVDVIKGQFSIVLGDVNSVPTDKLTGTTYIGITVDPLTSEMLPRQKLTSVAYALSAANAWNATNALYAQTALNVSNAIPKGVIVMWSGAVVPDGWALCNGANGTPNLRDKFILGAGSTYAIGATGGEATHVLTTSEMPSHSHGGASGNDSPDHVHYDAGHTHSTPWRDGTGGTNGFQTTQNVSGFLNIMSTGYANIGGASTRHTHSISAEGGGQAHNNMPPYYAIAFIMKM